MPHLSDPRPLRTVTVGSVRIVTEGDLVECHFEDGSVVRACPEETGAYKKTAAMLGYGEDVSRLNRTHDLAHCVLAEARGLPCSPALWSVAHGLPSTGAYAIEEDEVMALQHFANGGPRPAGDLDWDAIRARLLEVVG